MLPQEDVLYPKQMGAYSLTPHIKIIAVASVLKPEFEHNVFGQTQTFVSNIRFEFVRQSNILFGCPNICSKDTERMFSLLGLLLIKRRLFMTGENINIQLFLRDNLHVGRLT